jgi:hypothetical protein
LVAPFLVAAVLKSGFSSVSLIEDAGVTLVVLSIVALKFLRSTVVITGLFTVSLDQDGADILFSILVLLDGIVPS